jgi:hypothetical protein
MDDDLNNGKPFVLSVRMAIYVRVVYVRLTKNCVTLAPETSAS